MHASIIPDSTERTPQWMRKEERPGDLWKEASRSQGRWTRSRPAQHIYISEDSATYYIPSSAMISACRKGTNELDKKMSELAKKYRSETVTVWGDWEEYLSLNKNVTVVTTVTIFGPQCGPKINAKIPVQLLCREEREMRSCYRSSTDGVELIWSRLAAATDTRRSTKRPTTVVME